jgi:transposase
MTIGARHARHGHVNLRREGLRNGEIAQRMGTSSQAVANLICRAKRAGWDVPRDPYMTNRRGVVA